MRFFKKIDINKESRKLGDEYMPKGSIRVLNPYEVQKTSVKSGESEPEVVQTEIFKRIESRKMTRRSISGDAGKPGTKTESEEPRTDAEEEPQVGPSSSAAEEDGKSENSN